MSYTTRRHSGYCPGCGAHLHAYYALVDRDGKAYHAACDPSPQPIKCARCGLDTTGFPACDECYEAYHALMWFIESMRPIHNEIPGGFAK